jgi:hypothetical protein
MIRNSLDPIDKRRDEPNADQEAIAWVASPRHARTAFALTLCPFAVCLAARLQS